MAVSLDFKNLAYDEDSWFVPFTFFILWYGSDLTISGVNSNSLSLLLAHPSLMPRSAT